MKPREYSNGEIMVVWKAEKCRHAQICTKTLPQVYNIHQRPWIQPENTKTEDLIQQIDQCPSGALTYRYIDREKP